MKRETGLTYFILALLAFAGIGSEVLLAFVIEPMIYASPIAEWTVSQYIIHWVITCTLWGIVGFALTRFAKNTYGFMIFEKGEKLKAWQWGVGHFFTKDAATGFICMFSGLAYGSVYLLVSRDFRKAFLVTFIMFVL